MAEKTPLPDVDHDSDQTDDNSVSSEPESVDFTDMPLDESRQSENQSLDFFLDIPMNIKAQLGNAKLTISDVLHMREGSTIELETVAGGTSKLFVNNTLFALGEVVVVDDHLGIRITEFISQQERKKY
ncbi:MAG: FliM/FliN family flagellar motor switch protein [Thermodesulfobacteriota bacterium]|nr:FliM/FliN family flagellar motor switch protein [Thermodesulfobacteriota bacterium]